MHKFKSQVQDFLGCSGDAEFHRSTLEILPLGDSITFGIESPEGNGYRKQLQKLLERDKHVNVTFKGTERNGNMPNNHMAGWSAKTIEEVQGMMGPSLQQGADAVLVHIGTNDCNPDSGISRQGTDAKAAAARLGVFVDAVIEQCPKATILVAQIVGTVDDKDRKPQQQLIDVFNALIPNLVSDKAKARKHIKLVDMRRVVGSKFISPVIGGVHPNGRGYEEMAKIWAEALHDVSSALSEVAIASPPGPTSSTLP